MTSWNCHSRYKFTFHHCFSLQNNATSVKNLGRVVAVISCLYYYYFFVCSKRDIEDMKGQQRLKSKFICHNFVIKCVEC